VATVDADELRERQRRIDATIARASATHMSNAKWRKLFVLLRDLQVWEIRWKFVHDDRVVSYWSPPEWGLGADAFGDIMPYPGGPYREIEWVEIPAERAAGLIEALSARGQFPVQQLASGVRIIGYSW
jgi:hypothetical protein